MAPPDGAEQKRIDGVISAFRQGHCFLGNRDFISLGRIETDTGVAEDWLATTEIGFVIVSQTCDIVRSCESRPLVELSPLVIVEQKILEEVLSLRRPSYAAIPALVNDRVVVDLDRTMTVEKAVVVNWQRTPGLRSDSEIRDFQSALARKRQRFAFPDDFNHYVEPLQKRLIEKHGKESPEGEALRALYEIRVQALPSWDAAQVTLRFYFIRKQDSPDTFDNRPWSTWCADWMKRLPGHCRFTNSEGLVVDYSSITAAEYLQSDRLDLERLSAAE